MKKKILITGIKSGFGKSLSHIFALNNYTIYALTKNAFKSDDNTKVSFVNFKNLNQIKSKLQKLLYGVKKIDYVILNAGSLGPIKKTVNLTTNELINNLNINLFSHKIIVDFLINKKISFKSLIAISSGASYNPKYGWYSYTLSKSSLRLLIENYSIENKKLHFINCSPGLIETSMQKKIRKINKKQIPSIETFINAYRDNLIQTPDETALKFYNSLLLMRKLDSGSYIDLRTV